MSKLRKHKLEFCKFCGDPMESKTIKREYCSDLCRVRNFTSIKKGLRESEAKLKLEDNTPELLIKAGGNTYSELRDKLKAK